MPHRTSLPESASMPQLHLLPPLPYDYAALEPVIDERTLRLHHQSHHAGHVRALNSLLEGQPQLQGRSALWLLLNLDKVPRALRAAVRHHAGGHVNHSFYWSGMAPRGPSARLDGPLADAVARAFGSIEGLRLEFGMAVRKLFGPGWAWLARDSGGSGALRVLTTEQHLNPAMHAHVPLLAFDCWEHAHYLRYENRRLEALEAWWSIVNWPEVALRFALTWRPRAADARGLPARGSRPGSRVAETRTEA
jgi:Fe-Mn family superoxide dismutase